MDDPQLGNGKQKRKITAKEKSKEKDGNEKENHQWSTEESNLLLALMVEAAHRNWRDSSGKLGKTLVEERLLPVLNKKFGGQINYNHYQSRLKWFKKRYNCFAELLRFNSGFGWDSEKQMFTAPEEVWQTYFTAHPNHKHIRTDTFADYEDLCIAVGNATATGKNSISLGDVTEARTYLINELEHVNTDAWLDEVGSMYMQNEYESLSSEPLSSQPLFSEPLATQNGPSAEPLPSQSMKNKVPPITTTAGPKRKRTEPGNTSSAEKASVVARIESISTDFGAIRDLLERRESKETLCWDAIKEIPDLDTQTCFEALELLNTKAKKDMFLRMSVEERRQWILYKLNN